MKGEPTKGAQLSNEQMLRLNEDDMQRLGERMAARTGVWANEPTHYLAIVLGHLRRARAERDEMRLERREALDMLGRRLVECDAYQARGIELERELDTAENERDEARETLVKLGKERNRANAHLVRAATIIDRIRHGEQLPEGESIQGWFQAWYRLADDLQAQLTPPEEQE